MRTPKKIVFLHIPKTAGTSLVNLLEENYCEEERAAIYSHKDLDFHLENALNNPRIKVIYGHFPLRPCIINSDAFVFTFFRDPVKRVISQYKHHANSQLPLHVELMDKVAAPADYLKLPQAFNRQTRIMSGHLKNAAFEADTKAVNTAIANLERLDFVGFTSRFDASITLLAEALNWRFCYKVNTNKGVVQEVPNIDWESVSVLDQELFDEAWKRYSPLLSGVKFESRGLVRRYLRTLSSKFWPK